MKLNAQERARLALLRQKVDELEALAREFGGTGPGGNIALCFEHTLGVATSKIITSTTRLRENLSDAQVTYDKLLVARHQARKAEK